MVKIYESNNKGANFSIKSNQSYFYHYGYKMQIYGPTFRGVSADDCFDFQSPVRPCHYRLPAQFAVNASNILIDIVLTKVIFYAKLEL